MWPWRQTCIRTVRPWVADEANAGVELEPGWAPVGGCWISCTLQLEPLPSSVFLWQSRCVVFQIISHLGRWSFARQSGRQRGFSSGLYWSWSLLGRHSQAFFETLPLSTACTIAVAEFSVEQLFWCSWVRHAQDVTVSCPASLCFAHGGDNVGESGSLKHFCVWGHVLPRFVFTNVEETAFYYIFISAGTDINACKT